MASNTPGNIRFAQTTSPTKKNTRPMPPGGVGETEPTSPIAVITQAEAAKQSSNGNAPSPEEVPRPEAMKVKTASEIQARVDYLLKTAESKEGIVKIALGPIFKGLGRGLSTAARDIFKEVSEYVRGIPADLKNDMGKLKSFANDPGTFLENWWKKPLMEKGQDVMAGAFMYGMPIKDFITGDSSLGGTVASIAAGNTAFSAANRIAKPIVSAVIGPGKAAENISHAINFLPFVGIDTPIMSAANKLTEGATTIGDRILPFKLKGKHNPQANVDNNSPRSTGYDSSALRQY